MQAFADLYTALDETNKTNEKVAALVRYFGSAPPEDAAWALYFLIGRKPRQVVASARLREWTSQAAGIPDWLFQESYDAVGDLAETIALLLPFGDDGRPTMDDGPQTEDSGPRTEDREPESDSLRLLMPRPPSSIPNAQPKLQTPKSQIQNPKSKIQNPHSLSAWIEERLLPLRGADEATQRAAMVAAWGAMGRRERYVWNKLITGAFRVGVSQLLVTRALAQVSGIEASVIAHRLMGAWEPTAAFYRALLAPETGEADRSQPYPFFLAYPLEADPAALGPLSEWQAEWKWDGIRAQLIHRAGETFLWTRGEELVTERYPELHAVGELLPDGSVIDGEILPWRDGAVLPFGQLQRRIGLKSVGKKVLAEVPVVLLAYDLLEHAGQDIRTLPLAERRTRLEALVEQIHKQIQVVQSPIPIPQSPLIISPTVTATDWSELAAAREEGRSRNVEGLMLKRLGSPYRVGRQKGDWWKWKVNPFTIDAVLIYAQRGSGKRASLYTDYTFGVWDDGKLVPFAKAYSGLSDEEIREVDAFVRRNTTEKFGPVRTVKPELVFELAFEGIQRSARHKSGIAVRFPRMLRWRKDKPISEADSLETIRALLPSE